MKFIFCIIISLFSLAAVYSADDYDVPFDDKWLPIVRNLASTNSSSIELVWGPSGLIKDVDIDKLSGNFSVSLYVNNGRQMFNELVLYMANKLNSTDSIIVAGLTSDTVYQTCLFTQWHGENGTTELESLRYIPPKPCRLVRTYMTGKLN